MTTATLPEQTQPKEPEQSKTDTDPRKTPDPRLILNNLTERFVDLKINDFATRQRSKKFFAALVRFIEFAESLKNNQDELKRITGVTTEEVKEVLLESTRRCALTFPSHYKKYLLGSIYYQHWPEGWSQFLIPVDKETEEQTEPEDTSIEQGLEDEFKQKKQKRIEYDDAAISDKEIHDKLNKLIAERKKAKALSWFHDRPYTPPESDNAKVNRMAHLSEYGSLARTILDPLLHNDPALQKELRNAPRNNRAYWQDWMDETIDKGKKKVKDKAVSWIVDGADWVHDKTWKHVDDKVLDHFANKSSDPDSQSGFARDIRANALRLKKKKKNFKVLRLAGIVVGGAIKKAITKGAEVLKITSLVRNINNTFVRPIKTLVANIKVNPKFQSLVTNVKTLQRIPRFVGHITNGFKTGLLGAIAGGLIGGPVGAVGLGALGQTVGSMNSWLDGAYNFKLNEAASGRDLFGLNKVKVNYALNNPVNKGIAVEKSLEGLRSTSFNASRLRTLHLGLKAFGPAMMGAIIGSFLGPGAAMLGAIVGGGGSLALGYASDKIAIKILENSRLAQFLKFPGFGAIFNTTMGSYWLDEQIDLIKKKGFGTYFKEDLNGSMFGIPFIKSIVNGAQAISYVSGLVGMGEMGDWMTKVAITTAKVPTHLKLLPLLTTLGYVVIASVFGLPITPGILMAMAGAGFIGTVVGGIVGSLTSTVTGPLGIGFGTYAGVGTAAGLMYPAYHVGRWIDQFIGKNMDMIMAPFKIMGILNIFQALNDFMEGRINRLSDYVGITISLVMLLSTLHTFSGMQTNHAVGADPKDGKDSAQNGTSIYNNIKLDSPDVKIAQEYTIPPRIFDCQDMQGDALVSDTHAKITDIISLNENGVVKQNVKGENNGQKVIFKNLQSLSEGIVSDAEIAQNSTIGYCR